MWHAYLVCDGSTLRIKDVEHEEVRKKRRHLQLRRNCSKATSMDLPYLITLILAISVTLVICVQYLELRSSCEVRLRNISRLEKEIETLARSNDTLQDHIAATSLNINTIYSMALSDLGMRNPGRDQIIYYMSTSPEYVKQNSDIPRH